MFEPLFSRSVHRWPNWTTAAARTDGPEADTPQPVAADAEPADTNPDRNHLDDVEHLRQSRLRRWQTQGGR